MPKSEILIFLFIYLTVLILPGFFNRKSAYLGLSEDSILIKNVFTRYLILTISTSLMIFSVYLACKIYADWWK